MSPDKIEDGVYVNSKKLPTVFKWDGGGKNVSISGSFDNWTRQIPMVKRLNNVYFGILYIIFDKISVVYMI